MEKPELLCSAGGNVKCAAAVENSMAVPQNNKNRLLYDPEILLLGKYSKELKEKTEVLHSCS